MRIFRRFSVHGKYRIMDKVPVYLLRFLCVPYPNWRFDDPIDRSTLACCRYQEREPWVILILLLLSRQSTILETGQWPPT